jgi:hypothetical protein
MGALAAALLLGAGVAGAQPPVEPTPAQVELYQRANEAFARDEWDNAIELLESALALGEINILHLSLGRTLFRDGRCAEAALHYDRALVTPAVADPPPAEVAARVEAYRADLAAGCPGSLVVVCRPLHATVTVDDGEPRECTSAAFTLPPGSHRVVVSLGTRSASETVRIEPMGETQVVLSVEDAAAPPVTPPITSGRPGTAEPRTTRPLRIAGLSLSGAGLALLLGAALVDAITLGDAIDRFRDAAAIGDPRAEAFQDRASRLQSTALALYLTASLLGAAGAALFVVDLVRGEETEPAVDVALAPGGLILVGHY